MTNRVEYIDIAKGIGILLVYIGHCFLNKDGMLFQSIYSFHMPLFFLISGMLFQYNPDYGIAKIIYGKVVTLLLPYLLFTVLYCLCFLAFRSNPIVYLLYGWGRIPLWFIPILFAIEIIHLLLFKGRIIFRIIVGGIIISLFTYKTTTNGWLPYCVSEIPWFYLCFISGFFLKIFTPKCLEVFHCLNVDGVLRTKNLTFGGGIIRYVTINPFLCCSSI